MQKLKFINANGMEIDLTNHTDYGITNWEGFSADGLNIQSQQVPFQDGSVFLDALIESRELNVTVAIKDNNDMERRYHLRRELIALMNPKLGEGVLIYTNDFLSKQIHVIPQLPVFENKNSNDPGTPKASLSWTACNPFWEDLEETEVTFQIGQQPIIKNEGDVPCQIEMDWFTNYVKNGRVTNVTQVQKIQYNGDLNNSLKIITEVGEKSVTTENLNFNADNIGTNYNSISYSNELDLFVTIGYDGIILTSPDGITWTSQTSGISAGLYDITYSAELNLFVAVGGSGTILTSSNGINWTSQTSGVSDTLNGITYSSELGLFVAVGDSGTILTSFNASLWIQNNFKIFIDLNKIIYSNKLSSFIIIGHSGIIITSSFINIENRIQNISSDSDIGMNLGIGDNQFRINRDDGNMVVRIKYRQKYIGV